MTQDKIEKIEKIGIIMNGVTGRMGTNQHLMRSIVPIVKQGGVKLPDGRKIVPDPVLVGRNPEKLKMLAEMSGVRKWTTDLSAALNDTDNKVYFDSQTTERRAPAVKEALAGGKCVYCEKPIAANFADALELHMLAKSSGLANGVVQDKLFLPGLIKLKSLIDEGFFGRILSVRGEFGYWVFEGEGVAPQRPSWNYRKADGGGIILDMFPHWGYVLSDLFGAIRSVSCFATTHVKQRWDESHEPYPCTAADSAYATFALEGDVVAHINSSWAVRVRRDDLLTLQVDGTGGSAVAGLRDCVFQSADATPRVLWSPDEESPIDFYENWTPAPSGREYDNAFKVQWELFLKHVAADEPFGWTFLEGAKGVLLAERATESWQARAWVDVPNIQV